MTEEEFYKYFYKIYYEYPLAAHVKTQDGTIFHLKMEIAKLKKQVSNLSQKKED